MNKKLIFLFTLLLSIFFRLYRLNDLQYWSVDEEGLYLSARRISSGRLILLAPSATTMVSMGPLLSFISAFIFWITESNLVLVLAIASFIGVITSLVIYKAGRLVFNQRAGLIAFFLYSCSFLLSLYDRRWWQLSLHSLLIILSIIALNKLINRKYKYALLLAFTVSFAWNADPSLLVIILVTFFSFLFFKLPVFRRQYLPALLWLVFSLSPFFLAEMRHPGSVIQPLRLYSARIFNIKNTNFTFLSTEKIKKIGENFNRSLFTFPSDNIDDNFFCIANYSSSWFSPYSTIISIFLSVLPGIFFFFSKKKKDKALKKNIILLYIFLGSFLFGVFIFNSLTKVEIIQSYFLVSWPVFLLLVAFGLELLWRKKFKIVVSLFLSTFFFSNLYALFYSKMSYPLKTKIKVVDRVIENLTEEPFALYYEGRKYGFVGGGWDSLFIIRKRPPSFSQFSHMIKWIYQAYSLYATKPEKEENLSQKVQLFAPDIIELPEERDDVQRFEVENINIFVISSLKVPQHN